MITSIGFDPAIPGSDRTVVHGGTFHCELKPGENWAPHPAGGIIIVHPERPAVWVREVDGKVASDTLSLQPAVNWPTGSQLG